MREEINQLRENIKQINITGRSKYVNFDDETGNRYNNKNYILTIMKIEAEVIKEKKIIEDNNVNTEIRVHTQKKLITEVENPAEIDNMIETDRCSERDNTTIKYKTRLIQIKITKENKVINTI